MEMTMSYILISPRGFANETILRRGSKAACEAAASIINDDVNAEAAIVGASHPIVRQAKRDALRYGDEIETLSEADVAPHRPVMLYNDGSRRLGREPLPA